MSILEIDVHRVRTGAVQLGAASSATQDGATTLGQLRLSPEQAGLPDGAVVVQAVQRYTARAARRLGEIGSGLRGHSVEVRHACRGYTEADRALAARLRSIR